MGYAAPLIFTYPVYSGQHSDVNFISNFITVDTTSSVTHSGAQFGTGECGHDL
jgi:hypothetical protein